MKILYFSNNFLDGFSGGNFASRAFINAFSEIASEFMLLYPDRGQDVSFHTKNNIIAKGVHSKKHKLLKLIDIYTGKISRYIDIGLNEIISFNPDIIVFDGSRTSAILIDRVKELRKIAITIHHNYEMEYYKGTPEPILWRIPFNYFMRNVEKNAVVKSNLNLTLTDQDRYLLQKNYGSGYTVNIQTIGCFEPETTLKMTEKTGKSDSNINLNTRSSKNLIFVITGSLSAFQTEYSLIEFIKNCYPILIKIASYSKLIIAGKNPSRKLTELCNSFSTIELIANPLDIQPILDTADIYLCPISVGGGLKLRVMDGLRSGLPILSHVVSSRGYDAFLNAGFLFDYSDKLSFEKSLKQIIIEQRQNDKNNIKELYEKIFSFNAGLNRLTMLLNENILSTN